MSYVVQKAIDKLFDEELVSLLNKLNNIYKEEKTEREGCSMRKLFESILIALTMVGYTIVVGFISWGLWFGNVLKRSLQKCKAIIK